MITGRRRSQSNGRTPKKIAILGGGMAALAAAFELTDDPRWQEKYEITVYQMGWRLGGKCASARNAAKHYRIEEHGLHLWFGVYDNSFDLMQRCYRALDRPPTAPLPTWSAAFRKQEDVVLEEYVDDGWVRWAVQFPANDETPGQPSPVDLLTATLPDALAWLLHSIVNHSDALNPALDDVLGAPLASVTRSIEPVARMMSRLHNVRRTVVAANTALRHVGNLLERGVGALSEDLEKLVAQCSAYAGSESRKLLRSGIAWLARAVRVECRPAVQILKTNIEHHHDHVHQKLQTEETIPPGVRRVLLLLDLWCATARGILEEGVLLNGLDVLDTMDLQEFLRKYGATDEAVMFAPIRALYNAGFAFPAGKAEWPAAHVGWSGRFAAGAAIRAGLKIFAYKGAIMWKMNAGMGEAVIAPLYLVLKKRGVRFKFFHKVIRLEPDEQGDRVERIVVERQAHLNSGSDDYDPLITVPSQGLPCWPTEPKYQEIVEGPELEQKAVNLESAWTDWRGEPVVLSRGTDFDDVILAISLGSLKDLCAPLIQRARPSTQQRWRDMLDEDKLPTVRTHAVQFWMKPTLAGLGWSGPPPVHGAYAEPLDTWADMSHLIECENWPADNAPGSIAYFCGVMPDDASQPAYGTHPSYPINQKEQVRTSVGQYMGAYIGQLWPRLGGRLPGVLDLAPHEIRDPVLEPSEAEGVFLRANIDPSERYVLAAPSTSRYRLEPDRSGFLNLFLAGDWTWSELNLGTVESAVMSAKHAVAGITGRPARILGYWFSRNEGLIPPDQA